MTEREHSKEVAVNHAHWEEMARIHPETEFYDVEGFLAGRCSLDSIELAGVGDVSGQSLLHLQCHFGMDTIEWARQGATRAVGVDFSGEALSQARDLATQAGVADRTAFVESDIYDLPDTLDETFDVVFTSYGVLNWLPDIEGWAEVAAHFVKPGGRFFIAELHPISHVFMDLSIDDDGTVRSDWPYFTDEELTFDQQGSYADYDATIEHTESVEWSHTLGEIVTALIDAGLVIDELREYPVACFEQFPGVMDPVEGEEQWQIPGEDYPLTFSVQAHKPA